MAADYGFLSASGGSGDAALMHITAVRLTGASIITVDTVVNVPANFIGTYGTLLSTGLIDPVTKCDFKGHISGATLVIDSFMPGSVDTGNLASGQVVIIKPNTPAQNDMVTLAKVAHNNDGTIKNGAVSAATMLSIDVVTTTKIADANVTSAKLAADISPVKFFNPYKFYAYRLAAQVMTMPGSSKVAFDTKLYDTGSNFDAVTNARFTVPVAGFYQFSACVGFAQGSSCNGIINLYKNGSRFIQGNYLPNVTGVRRHNYVVAPPLLPLVPGDYIEIFLETDFTGNLGITSGFDSCYFGGYLSSTT